MTKIFSNLFLLALSFTLLWVPESMGVYSRLELTIFTCTGALIIALQAYSLKDL